MTDHAKNTTCDLGLAIRTSQIPTAAARRSGKKACSSWAWACPAAKAVPAAAPA